MMKSRVISCLVVWLYHKIKNGKRKEYPALKLNPGIGVYGLHSFLLKSV
ncbi:MAG: hypothetical protein JXB88_01130 [Spirochaetales bacterium]|nr:hypothetical protein [Spirochaetales bacterium]